MRVFHVTRLEDLASIQIHGLEPRTGPRSASLGETSAAIYLFESLDVVQDALIGWLGDAFDDDQPLVVLEIDATRFDLVPGAGFEFLCFDPIPADSILNVLNEDFETMPPMQNHPVLSEARTELSRYLNASPEEKLALQPLIDQLLNDPDPFDRSNMKGHITASALILSPDGEQVLMVHHNVYDMLLNPGGHQEGFEKLRDAALREGGEETGVQGLIAHKWNELNERPFDIDTHAIAANSKKGEGDHFHHDFIYLFEANPLNPLAPQLEEVQSAGWFPTSDLAKSGHPRLERLHTKLVDNGLTKALGKSPRP